MRATGPRALPRSVGEASRRLSDIEVEMEQILSKYPDLRRDFAAARGSGNMPRRHRFRPPAAVWHLHGSRVH